MKNTFSLILITSLLALGFVATGCGTTTPAAFADAMKGDNATLVLKYSGAYGPLTVIRQNPKPGQSTTVTADGAITTTWVGSVTNSP